MACFDISFKPFIHALHMYYYRLTSCMIRYILLGLLYQNIGNHGYISILILWIHRKNINEYFDIKYH